MGDRRALFTFVRSFHFRSLFSLSFALFTFIRSFHLRSLFTFVLSFHLRSLFTFVLSFQLARSLHPTGIDSRRSCEFSGVCWFCCLYAFCCWSDLRVFSPSIVLIFGVFLLFGLSSLAFFASLEIVDLEGANRRRRRGQPPGARRGNGGVDRPWGRKPPSDFGAPRCRSLSPVVFVQRSLLVSCVLLLSVFFLFFF